MFVSEAVLSGITWQGFERLVARVLLCQGYGGIRLVGQSSDGGADILATRNGKRWLVQVKRWSSRVGLSTIDRTLQALATYVADVPLIVSLGGFEPRALEQQRILLSRGIPLQLWDKRKLLDIGRDLAAKELQPTARAIRDYQEEAIDSIQMAYADGRNRALVVLATGLGKTFVAAEWYRRVSASRPFRILVVAHTNDLVYQLERAFWPVLPVSRDTTIWNGIEKPSESRLQAASLVFACLPTVYEFVQLRDGLPKFDAIIVDECHHAGSPNFAAVLQEARAGVPGGPFLLGLTATPWRADEVDLAETFGEPVISVDLVTGLRRGFLANVDYRMYTDNIDWERLRDLRNGALTPRRINKTLFIDQWDDAVIDAIQRVWGEQQRPRAIVFCGTIEHALTVRDRLNARKFCRAEAVFSTASNGQKMTAIQRNRTLADFQDNRINVICAVDVLNEGIDVPDVNVLVFQRVTHSRRIFVQQLGRGLRLAEGKDRVIVLDFVSDIRRFAAGLDLKDKLSSGARESLRIRLPSTVTFRRLGEEDEQGEAFIREWLEDVAAVEAAGEDSSVLRFPPPL